MNSFEGSLNASTTEVRAPLMGNTKKIWLMAFDSSCALTSALENEGNI